MTTQQLTLDQLGNRTTIRDNSQRADEVMRISLDKIVIRDGFNVRQHYGDIKGLAQSILENGQTLPGRVDVLADGTFVLADGHRRYEALKLLETEGNDCYFMAIVNKTKTTEEQRILQMFTTQDNKPLDAIEVCELIQRLVNIGHTPKAIADKIGKSRSYVDQMLSLATESPQIKEHVKNGTINVSTVLKTKRTTPNAEERSSRLADAIKNSNGKSSGVSKIVRVAQKNEAKTNHANRIAKAIIKDDKMQTQERLVEIILELL
jgi:ParB/RepB/Spo0J family partition protein